MKNDPGMRFFTMTVEWTTDDGETLKRIYRFGSGLPFEEAGRKMLESLHRAEDYLGLPRSDVVERRPDGSLLLRKRAVDQADSGWRLGRGPFPA